MPIIKKSSYNPPNSIIYRNPHLSTIIPGIIKKYPVPPYQREHLELNDGDFLLLDWWKQGNNSRLIILSHGLEGHSRRTYINSCADYFYQHGYSILAWNQRSCGGEINRLPKLYHMGMIDDLNSVVHHAIEKGFSEIYLIGFSMGGVVSLNYIGKINIPPEVRGCVAFSTPLNVLSNVKTFKKLSNFIYLQTFMLDFKRKLKYKYNQYPEIFDKRKIRAIKSFDELDDFFTAPLFGFKNKEDYYRKVSPIYVLNYIKIPTLIVNAENDPFLSRKCYLVDNQLSNPNIFFEKPKYGGHVGFLLEKGKYSWAEIRAQQFIDFLKK